MADEPNSPPENRVGGAGSAGSAVAPGDTQAGAPAVEPRVIGQLSAEEQMARYEEDLKENDWGHQPC
jgi:hypothetical protein